ncbi:MAG: hypothetical protein ACK4MF_07340 [Hyphomicrobiaceae bacterium]
MRKHLDKLCDMVDDHRDAFALPAEAFDRRRALAKLGIAPKTTTCRRTRTEQIELVALVTPDARPSPAFERHRPIRRGDTAEAGPECTIMGLLATLEAERVGLHGMFSSG